MTYLEIIQLGYIINIYCFLFIIVLSIISTINTFIEHGVNNNLQSLNKELKNLRKKRKFINKYSRLIAYFIPFCGIIRVFETSIILIKSKFDNTKSFLLLIEKIKKEF